MEHFDFFVALSKSDHDQAAKLLKEATNEQVEALVICLSLRTLLLLPPVSENELKIINRLGRTKRAKVFLQKSIKFVIPILTLVLSKSLKETLDSTCDLI